MKKINQELFIAILDDDPDFAYVLSRMIEKVLGAGKVQVHIQTFRTTQEADTSPLSFDLLFLDVELPDVLGLNLLSEMRDDVLWDMKVVFYTSYDKYLLQALRESAFDFLLKPFETEDLKVVIERYRKAVASIPAIPSSSFSSSVSALMPQQGMFMISTVTGFKLLRLEEIGYFEYLKDKRQWQVVLFNQTRLNLKRNTKAEDIIGYSQAFIQISQSAIVNVNYLAMIDGKCCQLYPPFHDKSDLVISRSFLKGLQDRFFVL